MLKHLSINGALLRALMVVVAVGILVAGVTFAALQSQQAVLAGNTIQTQTASLLIGTDAADSSLFSNSHSGFNFTDLVPGGAAQPAGGETFYLKNTGTATLKLKLNVDSTPSNPNNVDLSKVTVTLTRVGTGKTDSASLDSLASANGGLTLSDTLAPNATSGEAYKLSVSMADDAFNGSSASIGSFDFDFSGTGV